MAILALLAMALGTIGFLLLAQATTGVGLIGLACLLAIFARLAQASSHHNEAMCRGRAGRRMPMSDAGRPEGSPLLPTPSSNRHVPAEG